MQAKQKFFCLAGSSIWNQSCFFSLSSNHLKKCMFQKNKTMGIVLKKDVCEALEMSKPVVALESTIITHGMPYPSNLQTAIEVQDIVHQHGAVPATIGILNGNIHVGLDDDMIKQLSLNENNHKISRRDIAVAVAKSLSGGTTVSATMLIANWCGIKVFVTGGVGGVHRMGEVSMDVSADLRELGRTPVMVVSAGVKSILDIGRTLEYLETEGVTVATFGKSKDFPAFFTQNSGFPSPYNVTSIDEAAALLAANSKLNMDSGLLLAAPIPDELEKMGNEINDAISKALKESKEQKISGKNVTPFILQRVNELTSGMSLKANMLLIKNNAEIGAKIAKCYSELSSKAKESSSDINMPVVVGGSNLDVVSKSLDKLICGGASNPARVRQTLGGVARNIAEVLWRLNANPYFVSAVGGDYSGKTLLHEMRNMNLEGVARVDECRTGVYNVVIDDDGEVFVAVVDGDAHSKITPEYVEEQEERFKQSRLVCVDANIPEATMRFICSLGAKYDIPVLYEPTGVLIAAKGYQAKSPYDYAITYMTPSLAEFVLIYQAVTGKKSLLIPDAEILPECDDEFFNLLAGMCKELLQWTPCILVTLGSEGVFVVNSMKGNSQYTHYPISPRPCWPWLDDPVANVSGAGDSFAAGFAFGLLRHNDIDKAVRIGITVAQRTLRSHRSVSADICEADEDINASDWKGRVVDIHDC